MKTIFIICAIFGATLAMPNGKSWNIPARAPEVHTFQVATPVQRVEYVSRPVMTEYRVEGPRITGSLYKTMDTYGQYKYGYSSSDGQAKTEHRMTDGGVSGHFSYQSPEGKTISLAYLADKDGFRPVGDHLPVAPEVPPMPADLAAAYKESNDRLAKAHEEARLRGDTEFSDDGSYKAEVKVGIPETKYYQTYVQHVPVVAAPTMYTYQTKNVYKAPAVAAPAPQPKPVEYKSISYTAELSAPAPVTTYKTYSAALPTKSIYIAPAVAAPAPAPQPKPVEYKSISYTAELSAPAPVTAYKTYIAPAVAAPAPQPKPVEYKSISYTAELSAPAPVTAYKTYITPAVAAPAPAPQPKPVEYKSISYTAELSAPAPVTTYKTYSAALPTKSIYIAPAVAAPAPQPKPVEYKSISYTAELSAPAPVTTYKTYSAALPTKSIYVAAPKPKQATYSSSSYSTEIGGAAPLIPTYKMTYETVPQKSIVYTVPKPIEYSAPTPATVPAPAPLAMKSAYAFTGGY